MRWKDKKEEVWKFNYLTKNDSLKKAKEGKYSYAAGLGHSREKI